MKARNSKTNLQFYSYKNVALFHQCFRNCEADGASVLARLIQQMHQAAEPVYQAAD